MAVAAVFRHVRGGTAGGFLGCVVLVTPSRLDCEPGPRRFTPGRPRPGTCWPRLGDGVRHDCASHGALNRSALRLHLNGPHDPYTCPVNPRATAPGDAATWPSVSTSSSSVPDR